MSKPSAFDVFLSSTHEIFSKQTFCISSFETCPIVCFTAPIFQLLTHIVHTHVTKFQNAHKITHKNSHIIQIRFHFKIEHINVALFGEIFRVKRLVFLFHRQKTMMNRRFLAITYFTIKSGAIVKLFFPFELM